MKKSFLLLITLLLIFTLSSCHENCLGSSHTEEIYNMIDNYIDSEDAVSEPASLPNAQDTYGEDTEPTDSQDTSWMRKMTEDTTVYVGEIESPIVIENDDQSSKVLDLGTTKHIEVLYPVKDKFNSVDGKMSEIESDEVTMANPLIYYVVDYENYYKVNENNYDEESAYYIEDGAVYDEDKKKVVIFIEKNEVYEELYAALTGSLVDALQTSEVIGTPNSYKETDELRIVENAVTVAMSDTSSQETFYNALSYKADSDMQEAIKNTATVLRDLSEGSRFSIIDYLKDKYTDSTTTAYKKVSMADEALVSCYDYFDGMVERAENNTATKQDLLALKLAQTYSSQYANVFLSMLHNSKVAGMTKANGQVLTDKAKIFDNVSGLDISKCFDIFTSVVVSN